MNYGSSEGTDISAAPSEKRMMLKLAILFHIFLVFAYATPIQFSGSASVNDIAVGLDILHICK
jgi:hypothetical protein